MKKSLFAILAVAACFASCSKVVESSVVDKTISFNNYLANDATTRASIISKTLKNLDTVHVNAFLHPITELTTAESQSFLPNFMNAQSVDTLGNYSPYKYWPASDQVIDFVAWVPVSNATVNNAELTFSVPTDVKAQQDLIVAAPQLNKNNAELPEGQQDVNLVFSHLLSRIGFQINSKSIPNPEQDSETTVELDYINVKGSFASQGKVNLLAAEPTVVGTEAQVEYKLTGQHFGYKDSLIVSGNASTKNLEDSYIMLIPTANHQPDSISIQYIVRTKNGTENKADDTLIKNHASFPLTTKFEAGKAYRYVFSISMNAISFKVEEDTWDPETETPLNNNKNE